MNKSHSLIKVFFKMLKALTKLALIIAGINFIFSLFSKRTENEDDGQYYKWRLGKIFYTHSGEGKPVLLVHGLEPDNSSADFKDMKKELEKTHEVYAIDLLGFGKSDAPWITYTNYIYVLLINDFIKDVIKNEPCDIVAAEGSCLSVLQARKMNAEFGGKIVLLSPYKGKAFNYSANTALRLKEVFETPLLGTLLYNIFCIGAGFKNNAHGKYVFLSRLSGHLTTDLSRNEKLIDDKCNIIDFGDEIEL